MTRTRSRKLQIVTFIVGVSIAALFWAGLLINLDRLAQTYDRLTIEQTQSLALAFEEQTERTFQVVDSALFALKREYEASPAGFVLEAGLGHIDLPKKIVRRIAVVDAQGLILRTEAGPPSQVVSVADREYFRSQRQADVGLLVSPPLIGRASGLWGIQLSRRLQAPDGSFAGVIVATIDPSYLAQFFARVSPKPGSSVTPVGLDGLVRAHSPVINGIEGQDVSGGPLFAHLKQASNGFYRAVSIIDGTERFLSYRSIPDLALVITVGTSVAEALAPQRAQRDQTLIAAGVGTLAIGALLWGLVAAIETRRQLSIERDFQAGRLGIANERLGESEERYRSLIENLTEVVFRTDREGRWTFLNRAWAELTGFEVEETLQRPFLASFQTNDGEEGWRQFEALLAGDLTACRFESRYLTKTGEACWIEIFARLVRDAQGAITGTAGTLSDITERRDALDALRDSELRYAEKSRTLAVTLENIEQGIVMIAADGSVPVSNGRAIELLDLPPDLMATRPHFQTVLDYQSKAGEFDGLEPEAVARVVKGCLAREVLIYERTRANGRTIEFRSVPLDGGGIVRTYTDVTERRASEKVLREAKEVAEQASRTRTAFLATLSHEIRTPLNGVIGLTDLLLATPLDAMQGDYVRGLAASTEHLLLIVDDVLDFAKLDADRLELEQIPFDLFELVNGTIDILTPRAAAKQLTIAAKLPSGGIHHFYGDAKRTRQILLNIVGNGVKFTDHGEVLVVAEVQPSGGSARIILSVKDTGIGIPPEARDRLFDEFTQFDSSITRRFGGTGLGLAICKRLVEAMAGKITVANDGDGYTTFRVELSLPIANAADLPVLLREAQPIVLERGLRVLLAEDNQTNQMIVQITL